MIKCTLQYGETLQIELEIGNVDFCNMITVLDVNPSTGMRSAQNKKKRFSNVIGRVSNRK